MERLRSDDTIRKQKVGLYCDIYDEQAVIWKTLFPGMDLESIIKDKIPKFVQGIDALKLPSQDIISEVPMNIADYVQLGWIDPALVRN